LQRIVIAFLQVVYFTFAVLAHGLLFGVLTASGVALLYESVARLWIIKTVSRKLYVRIEEPIINLINEAPFIIKIIKGAPASTGGHALKIASRQELQYLVADSSDIITPEEKQLVINGLSFNDRPVHEVMTPRDSIASVQRTEFLGPLVLDELSKGGHRKLPVISSDINHVVGILHLEGLLTLDNKRSLTAEKAMEPKVYYIQKNQTLEHALTEFLTTKHCMLIVVNESRETVGIVTLRDVIEALIGRKVVDEYDSHDSVRTVSMRKAGKTRPSKQE
jgi:CBS domain containing-hemolysin-like protein